MKLREATGRHQRDRPRGHPLPRLGARVDRGTGRCWDRSRAGLQGEGGGAEDRRELAGRATSAQPAADDVQGAARGRTERERRARPRPSRSSRRRTASADLSALRARGRRRPGIGGGLRARSRAGRVDWRPVVAHRGADKPGRIKVPRGRGRGGQRPDATPPISSCRAPATLEKDACYTNEHGLVQAAAQAIAPPGDAMEDWQILVNVGVSLGVGLVLHRVRLTVRADIAAAHGDRPGYADLARIAFARPVDCRRLAADVEPFGTPGSGRRCSRTCPRSSSRATARPTSRLGRPGQPT